MHFLFLKIQAAVAVKREFQLDHPPAALRLLIEIQVFLVLLVAYLPSFGMVACYLCTNGATAPDYRGIRKSNDRRQLHILKELWEYARDSEGV